MRVSIITKSGEVEETNWENRSACRNYPITMFSVARMSDPISEGLDTFEVRDLNEDNFAAAAKLCQACPVVNECRSSATDDDLEHTFRAGLRPRSYSGKVKGRPRTESVYVPVGKDRRAGEEPCPRGHVDWYKNSRGYFECRE